LDINIGKVNIECSQLDQPLLRVFCIKLLIDIRLFLFLCLFLTLKSSAL